MSKHAKTFLNWVLVATSIIGIVGIPDDLKRWGGILKDVAVFMDYPIVRLALVLIVVSVLAMAHHEAIASFLLRFRRKPSQTDIVLHRQMNPGAGPGTVKCPPCGGNGREWGMYQGKCRRCDGTGELPGELSQFPVCKLCEGTGREAGRYQQFCPVCRGVGVRIPANP